MANNTTGIIMPEMIIYKTLKSIFKIVQDDYNAAPTPEDSMLYSFFGKDENGDVLQFETFNYFNQAIETFVKKTPQVYIGYNMEVASMGAVHVLLPGEQGKPLSIGADENYQGYIEDDVKFKEIFTQVFESTYNMLITSENTFETILIYNLLKSSLLALNCHLELAGLRLPKTSGQDIQFQNNVIPPHIFHRSLMLNFIYELSVPSFFYRNLVKNFKITGIIENKEP